jgi:hypothetical protein
VVAVAQHPREDRIVELLDEKEAKAALKVAGYDFKAPRAATRRSSSTPAQKAAEEERKLKRRLFELVEPRLVEQLVEAATRRKPDEAWRRLIEQLEETADGVAFKRRKIVPAHLADWKEPALRGLAVELLIEADLGADQSWNIDLSPGLLAWAKYYDIDTQEIEKAARAELKTAAPAPAPAKTRGRGKKTAAAKAAAQQDADVDVDLDEEE